MTRYTLTEEQRQQLLDAIRHNNLEDRNKAVETMQSLAPVEDVNSTHTPVGFMCQGILYGINDVDEYCTQRHTPVFTHPTPLRELSDAEIKTLYAEETGFNFDDSFALMDFTRAVLAAASGQS